MSNREGARPELIGTDAFIDQLGTRGVPPEDPIDVLTAQGDTIRFAPEELAPFADTANFAVARDPENPDPDLPSALMSRIGAAGELVNSPEATAVAKEQSAARAQQQQELGGGDGDGDGFVTPRGIPDFLLEVKKRAAARREGKPAVSRGAGLSGVERLQIGGVAVAEGFRKGATAQFLGDSEDIDLAPGEFDITDAGDLIGQVFGSLPSGALVGAGVRALAAKGVQAAASAGRIGLAKVLAGVAQKAPAEQQVLFDLLGAGGFSNRKREVIVGLAFTAAQLPGLASRESELRARDVAVEFGIGAGIDLLVGSFLHADTNIGPTVARLLRSENSIDRQLGAGFVRAARDPRAPRAEMEALVAQDVTPATLTDDLEPFFEVFGSDVDISPETGRALALPERAGPPGTGPTPQAVARPEGGFVAPGEIGPPARGLPAPRGPRLADEIASAEGRGALERVARRIRDLGTEERLPLEQQIALRAEELGVVAPEQARRIEVGPGGPRAVAADLGPPEPEIAAPARPEVAAEPAVRAPEAPAPVEVAPRNLRDRLEERPARNLFDRIAAARTPQEVFAEASNIEGAGLGLRDRETLSDFVRQRMEQLGDAPPAARPEAPPPEAPPAPRDLAPEPTREAPERAPAPAPEGDLDLVASIRAAAEGPGDTGTKVRKAIQRFAGEPGARRRLQDLSDEQLGQIEAAIRDVEGPVGVAEQLDPVAQLRTEIQRIRESRAPAPEDLGGPSRPPAETGAPAGEAAAPRPTETDLGFGEELSALSERGELPTRLETEARGGLEPRQLKGNEAEIPPFRKAVAAAEAIDTAALRDMSDDALSKAASDLKPRRFAAGPGVREARLKVDQEIRRRAAEAGEAAPFVEAPVQPKVRGQRGRRVAKGVRGDQFEGPDKRAGRAERRVVKLETKVRDMADVITRLKEQSRREEFTGLMNRGADATITRAALRQLRKTPRTIQVVRWRGDIDNMKLLNELRGHPEGDKAIKAVARTVEAQERALDTVRQDRAGNSRVGGDEFAGTLILPKGVDAGPIIRRIEKAVNDAFKEAGVDNAGKLAGEDVPVGFSMAHVVADPTMTFDQLDAAADAVGIARKEARGASKGKAGRDLLQQQQTGRGGVDGTAEPDLGDTENVLQAARDALDEKKGDFVPASFIDEALRQPDFRLAMKHITRVEGVRQQWEDAVATGINPYTQKLMPEGMLLNAKAKLRGFETELGERLEAADTGWGLEVGDAIRQGMGIEPRHLDPVPPSSGPPAPAGPRQSNIRRSKPTDFEGQEVAAADRGEGIDGKVTAILRPNGEEIAVRYRLVNIPDVQPSHLPLEGFKANPKYWPEGSVQQRDLAKNKLAQEQTLKGKLEPRRLLVDTHVATEGAPTGSPDLRVVNGNERTNRIQIAESKGLLGPYREELSSKMAVFELPPMTPAQLKGKMLYREIVDAGVDFSNTSQLRQLNIEFDTPLTKAKTGIELSASRAGQILKAESALDHLGGTLMPNQTLRDYLSSSNGRKFADQLIDAGVFTRSELGPLMTKDGLTPAGKESIIDALLLATVGNVRAVRNAPVLWATRVEHGIPAILATAGDPDADIRPFLREAFEIGGLVKEDPTFGSVTDFLTQGGLGLGERGPADFSQQALDLAEAIESFNKRDLTDMFRAWARRMGGADPATRDIFDDAGIETREAIDDVFDEIFGSARRMREDGGGTCL